MDKLWTVDARFEVPGVVIELCRADWPSEVEIVDANVGQSSAEHRLALTLSPMPDLSEYSFLKPRADNYAAIGYLCLWPANMPFRSRSGPGRHRFLQVRIDAEWFEKLTGLGNSDWDPESGMNISGTAIDGVLLRIAREVAEPGFASKVLVEGLAMAVVADLARYLRATRVGTKPENGKLSAAQLQRIEQYVEAHEGSSLTVSDLADLIGVSRRHMTRVFKQTTSQTIHEYVANVRIRKASTLLCGTDLPLKEISHRLGFAGLASFSAAFRAATGQCPTGFRRQFRGLGAPKAAA
jgi:AraC family transcriptional regulator